MSIYRRLVHEESTRAPSFRELQVLEMRNRGLSYGVIADRLGVSAGTAATYAHTARRRLRECGLAT